MTLLREIQNLAVESSPDITTLLRKCAILAERLGHEEFIRWVSNELNGYGENDILPNYRKANYQHYGYLSNGARTYEKYPIPTGALPENIREIVEKYNDIRIKISQINDLTVNRQEHGGLKIDWNPNLLATINENEIFGSGYALHSAWSEISISFMVGLVDSIHNRILQFVLAIKKENKKAGEEEQNTSPVPQEKVKNIFNVTIMGDVGNIAAASREFTQNSYVTVEQGNLESLLNYLSSQGVEEKDLNNLESAIHEDEKVGEKNIGSKVKSWIGNMAAQVVSTASKVSIETLTKAIMDYFGSSPN